VVSEIRIYIEGGGDSRATRDELRRGYSEFLGAVRNTARQRRIRWHIVLCGGRENAYKDFKLALQSHPNAFNVLLVDAEAPVTTTPWAHLATRDGWDNGNVHDDHCQLMVQLQETWFVADCQTLQDFYGNGFNPNPIPKAANLEAVSKSVVLSALTEASKNTQKGEYRKIKHGAKLLERIRPAIVRTKTAHCERLFSILEREIAGN
jgi:hypothetical protein